MPRVSHYICNVPGCGKELSNPSSLKRHMKLHSDEMPHRCTIPGCSYKTRQESNFLRHIRTHTGEKPLACGHPGCSEYFSDPSQRTKHKKRRHGYVPGQRANKRDAVNDLVVSRVAPGEFDYLTPPAALASDSPVHPINSLASTSGMPFEAPAFNSFGSTGIDLANNQQLGQLAATLPQMNSQELTYPAYNAAFHTGMAAELNAPDFTFPMQQAQNTFGMAGPSSQATAQSNGFGFSTTGAPNGYNQFIPSNPDKLVDSIGLYLLPHEWPEMFADQSGLANGTQCDNQVPSTSFPEDAFSNGGLNFDPFSF